MPVRSRGWVILWGELAATRAAATQSWERPVWDGTWGSGPFRVVSYEGPGQTHRSWNRADTQVCPYAVVVGRNGGGTRADTQVCPYAVVVGRNCGGEQGRHTGLPLRSRGWAEWRGDQGRHTGLPLRSHGSGQFETAPEVVVRSAWFHLVDQGRHTGYGTGQTHRSAPTQSWLDGIAGGTGGHKGGGYAVVGAAGLGR